MRDWNGESGILVFSNINRRHSSNIREAKEREHSSVVLGDPSGQLTKQTEGEGEEEEEQSKNGNDQKLPSITDSEREKYFGHVGRQEFFNYYKELSRQKQIFSNDDGPDHFKLDTLAKRHLEEEELADERRKSVTSIRDGEVRVLREKKQREAMKSRGKVGFLITKQDVAEDDLEGEGQGQGDDGGDGVGTPRDIEVCILLGPNERQRKCFFLFPPSMLICCCWLLLVVLVVLVFFFWRFVCSCRRTRGRSSMHPL